ncbi:MAG: hypothetical protein KDJ29_20750 [Hyphomicrobiales bacterium]|nr:hypothetical protein [Hyphomicrobiales bacterium]
MKLRALTLRLAAVILTLSGAAFAGPFQDFESQARKAYGAYRAALFSTNTGDAQKSVAAIETFSSGWQGLAKKWASNPPPQYAEDASFSKDMQTISAIAAKALSEAKDGKLKISHVALERVREIVAGLRRRNGIVSYSDHVDAYHTQMEHMLQARYGDNRNRLVADTDALAYLAGRLESHAPAAYRQDAGFKQALAAVKASVATLAKAAADGDANAIMAARKKLKKPYAKLFLRWG